jgi:hypothetical protein
LASARDCTERIYTRENIYICLDIHAALQGLEASRIVLKMVLGCQQEICASCSRNKVRLLRDSGIQNNEDADVSARKG